MRNFLDRFVHMTEAAKSTIVFMIASLFSQGMGVLTTPIFTRILSTDAYGVVSIYNSWAAMIGIIAMLSLSSAGIFNVGMLEHPHNRAAYMSSTLILSNIATIVVLFIYLLFKDTFNQIINLPSSLIILMFLSFLLTPATNFWISRQRYEYKYKLSAIINIGITLLSPVCSLLIVLNYTGTRQAELRLWTANLIPLITALCFYIYIMYDGKQLININSWKKTLKFTLPLIPHYLSAQVLNSADRIMIATIISTSAAGIYGVVYTLSLVTTIIWNSINGSLVPYTFEKINTSQEHKINKVVKPLLMGYLLTCCLVTLLAPEVLRFLAPAQYYQGIYVIPPTVASVFFAALYNLFGNIEFYYKKSIFIMAASVMAATLNILLNAIFIPIFGFVAAAYTTLVTYISFTILHYWNCRRIHKGHLYDIRYIFLLSGISLIFMVISNFLYGYLILRYICIGIIGGGIILVLKKNIRKTTFKH